MHDLMRIRPLRMEQLLFKRIAPLYILGSNCGGVQGNEVSPRFDGSIYPEGNTQRTHPNKMPTTMFNTNRTKSAAEPNVYWTDR